MMGITKKKTKDIEGSYDVCNNISVSNFILELSTQAYKEGRKSLFSFLRKELEGCFGKCNRALRLEFYTRVWVLEYREVTFNVFTSKVKGTSIEIIWEDFEELRSNKELGKLITDFISTIYFCINKGAVKNVRK